MEAGLTSRLVRMPDQFTPGRGIRAAATPTCSCCCCCCCCVVTLVTSSVVLPVSAARARADANVRTDAPAEGKPDWSAALPRSRAALAIGYVALAIAPLATLSALIGVYALVRSEPTATDAGAAAAAAILTGAGLTLVGDQLVGRPRGGLSVALLAMFAALFVLELIVSAALVLAGGVVIYFVVALAALALVPLLYLVRRR